MLITKLDFLSQFHYGSIKTEKVSLTKGDFNIVSIPLWFD
ncbi:Hypothetical protein IALB_1211 [Ignavibacterium album JCM 16511]|uniref:Uncharacterized protein n=1 Tax=Ignavibacterium album (strain DSM 19864 / JCM 16511 / NBRC 101810 / Mat9-16) TaxID=945713 RepID=I0AIW5_IGNAJ|nr:Hypothetical protein IALB_1211 [Ignavibacterium album JCM 16511]